MIFGHAGQKGGNDSNNHPVPEKRPLLSHCVVPWLVLFCLLKQSLCFRAEFDSEVGATACMLLLLPLTSLCHDFSSTASMECTSNCQAGLTMSLLLRRFMSQDAGCEAILVGESLIKQDDVTSAVRTLLA